MIRALLCLSALLVGSIGQAVSGPLQLWYKQPAAKWTEALPVGNGSLGAMVFGGISKERIQLNESSLWSGGPQDADNPEALKALPEVRRLLFEGKYAEAEKIANRTLICAGKGSAYGGGAKAPYGSYQTLGDLTLEFVYPNGSEAKNYRRELDLSAAVARTTYTLDDVTITRNTFSSYPDKVLVTEINCSKPGQLNLSISLTRPEVYETTATGDAELLMKGQLFDGREYNGMKYAARVRVINEEGRVYAEGSKLKVEKATRLILLVSAATDYSMQLPNWRQGNPEKETREVLEKAGKKGIEKLLRSHIADFEKYFGRVELNLGLESKDAANLPTDQRLKAITAGGKDPEIAALYFQFGRYLLISSSRQGGKMPANLQGIWADTIQTPWNGDFHANINLQMNYWPADVANLSECVDPLVRYVEFMTGPGSRTAKVHYGARGWTVHTLANAWGFTAPGEAPSWGLAPSAGAWLSQNLWDHYLFTADKNYLKRIYPVLRGSALFSLDWLVEDPKTGQLVPGPANSPENTFISATGEHATLSMGPAVECEIVREAFQNYLEASRILKVSEPLTREIEAALKRVPGPRIGSDGRLMEWAEEFKEAEPGHRHISHLFALHPADEISPARTPELAKAARKSLEARLAGGGGHTGWSRAWIINFRARLWEGDEAGENVNALLAKSTLPNMLDTHPPFQIDGNFGGCAGIAEMLLQSHTGEIHLLPALPKQWADGSFKGLHARGNVEVEASWKGGKLQALTLTPAVSGPLQVRYEGNVLKLNGRAGRKLTVDPASFGLSENNSAAK